MLAERDQPFTLHAPPQPVFVSGDRIRLAQVFANLINNSAKYSEPGQPVSITFGREGEAAVVCVKDAGMGIHPEMLPRVFDMFRQADRTGGRSRGGLGIGLALVKRIVEMHGGTVIARSEGLGRGCEFVVRLPAIEATRTIVRTERDAANGSAPRRKILVVDDNADAAESLAALLSMRGHDTRMAHDGPEALQQAERFQPGRGLSRHRHADARWSRDGEAHSPAAVGQADGAGRADRMGTNRGSAPVEGRGLRPSPGEARRSGGRRTTAVVDRSLV